MKRTLTMLTAAIFAAMIAVPAFAQSGGDASPAAEASPAASPMGRKHHHHKKKSDSGSMASPAAAASDSTSR